MKKLITRSISVFAAFTLAFGVHYSAQASSTTARSLLFANLYYVSTTGNDANTCTQSAPCKTIKRGMSVTQSGDTVIVSAGVYHEYVYVDKSITLISNGATIDGVNASGAVTDGLVSVVADNVTIQGRQFPM
jgi:nitrous oxidase accessory protein NosD